MKKTKDYRGLGLKKRLMEVSGIREPKDKMDQLIDLEGLTYGELFDIIHTEVKNYFEETFDTPQREEDELDEELQRFLDDLDFEIK